MTRRRIHPPTRAESEWLRSVGKILRQLRERRGLGARETGRLARVSHAQIARIEAGEASDLLTVARLAEAVGAEVMVTVGDVLPPEE